MSRRNELILIER